MVDVNIFIEPQVMSLFPLLSSLGGHNEQENTLNQLLVEMDGELSDRFMKKVDFSLMRVISLTKFI